MEFGIKQSDTTDFIYREKSLFHFSCQMKMYFKRKSNILTEFKVFRMTHDI